MKKNKTLVEIAYETIKEDIMDSSLKPGDLIIENDLAKYLEMSRTPVRTAIQMLKQENLVETIPGKGTRVTELSISYLLDIFEIRMALEVLAVDLAAKNRSSEDILELENILERQISASKNNDTREFLHIDRLFHLELAKVSKNNLLYRELKRLNESYKRYLYFTNYKYRLTNVLDEHRHIIKLIEERKSEELKKFMLEHIEDVRLSIILALQRK